MNKEVIKRTKKVFVSNFNKNPDLMIFSPGRINFLGEHVDYNDGFVLPAAIDRAIYFAIGKRNDSKIMINSIDYNEGLEINLESEIYPSISWTNHILGSIKQMRDKFGHKWKTGFNCVFQSDLPRGVGISSSAALECGMAFAMNQLFCFGLNNLEIAKVGQMTEHTFVGVKSGFMDHFSNMFGKKDKVIKLDCRNLKYNYYKLNLKNYEIVLYNSMIRHSLVTSAYNDRRRECEEGISIIQKQFPAVKSLRDCNTKMLALLKNDTSINPVIYQRCSYVVKEIKRVTQACKFLEKSDIKSLGKLMFQTHEGLSKDYEVSCPEVDFFVSLAQKDSSVVGARMMGAGFGGCIIVLIKKGKQAEFLENVYEKYYSKYKLFLQNYSVSISHGTSIIY